MVVITVADHITGFADKSAEELNNASSPDEKPAVFFVGITRQSCSNRCMGDINSPFDIFLRKKPVLGQGVYIATGAAVLGDVTLGDYSSVWYNAVVRGDINRIVVGHHSNIQDNAMIHVADEFPCLIGNYVTIGHLAVVHACTVGNEVLIGMGATILDGAKIGDHSLIGANSLVTQGIQIPPGSLVLGSPAKVVRTLTSGELAELKESAEKYVRNSAYCLRHGINASAPLPT